VKVIVKFRLGMRTIKTGLGIYFSLLICNSLGLESGALAAITAVVCMQPSLMGSLKTIKNRFLGTIIGCVIAAVIAYYLPSHYSLVAISAMIIIWIFVKLGWQESITLAVITLILILDSTQGDYIKAVQNRIIVIFIGLCVAFLLNFLMPPRHSSRLINKVDELRQNFESFYSKCIGDILQSSHLSRQEVKEYTQKIRDLLFEAREIYVLSIDSKLGYKEDKEKDAYFLIRKAINAIQSNLERLLEIHRSIVLAPQDKKLEEIRQNIHYYLSSIFIYHKKIYNSILFGKKLENRIINEFAEEQKQLENKILELIKEAHDLQPLHFYNMVAEGERIMNKAWSLIEDKERFEIKVENEVVNRQ